MTDDSEPEFRAACPSCGSDARIHESTDCLNRWVHERFLGRTLSFGEAAPPYSTTPSQPCFDDLVNTPLWAEAAAVMQTVDGPGVGLLIRTDSGYEHYKIIATGSTLPLAVCRAAVSGLAGGGAAVLQIK